LAEKVDKAKEGSWEALNDTRKHLLLCLTAHVRLPLLVDGLVQTLFRFVPHRAVHARGHIQRPQVWTAVSFRSEFELTTKFAAIIASIADWMNLFVREING
jgi:hypothetical protein